jgi:hypothetical protein
MLGALCLLLTGCFSRETTLVAHPDGTGTLTIVTRLTPEYVAYLEGLTGSDRPERGFTEARLTARAGQYGEGVVYRRHRTERREGALILEVEYHVGDLDRLRLSLDPSLPLVGDRMEAAEFPAYPPLTLHDRGEGRLTLYPPRARPRPDSLRVKVESEKAKAARRKRFERERAQWMRFGNPFQLSGDETPIELARRLGRDMRFRLEVATVHSIRQTTSPYKVDGNKVLIYAIQASDFIQDPEWAERLNNGSFIQPSWADLAESDHVTVDSARFRILEQAPEPVESPP